MNYFFFFESTLSSLCLDFNTLQNLFIIVINSVEIFLFLIWITAWIEIKIIYDLAALNNYKSFDVEAFCQKAIYQNMASFKILMRFCVNNEIFWHVMGETLNTQHLFVMARTEFFVSKPL